MNIFKAIFIGIKKIPITISIILKSIFFGLLNIVKTIIKKVIDTIKTIINIIKNIIVYIYQSIVKFIKFIKKLIIEFIKFFLKKYLALEKGTSKILLLGIQFLLYIRLIFLVAIILYIAFYFGKEIGYVVLAIMAFAIPFGWSDSKKEEESIPLWVSNVIKSISPFIHYFIRFCFLVLPTAFAVYSNIDFIKDKSFYLFSTLEKKINPSQNDYVQIEQKNYEPSNYKEKLKRQIEPVSRIQNIYNSPKVTKIEVDKRVETASVEKSFLIVKSTKSYIEAKKYANKISKILNIKLDLRGLTFNKKIFLTFSKKDCEEEGGEEYPCYLARGRYDDGEYISIEHTNSYSEFKNGYYIVVVASGDNITDSLKKVKKKVSDAYIKKAKIYMGCIH